MDFDWFVQQLGSEHTASAGPVVKLTLSAHEQPALRAASLLC